MLGSLIHPEHSQELLNSFTLSLTEALVQAIEDGVIIDLGLTVVLRVDGIENWWAILYLTQKVVTSLLVKFVPLSEIIVCGKPKRHKCSAIRT